LAYWGVLSVVVNNQYWGICTQTLIITKVSSSFVFVKVAEVCKELKIHCLTSPYLIIINKKQTKHETDVCNRPTAVANAGRGV
jgi:hypothetical protein